MYADRTPRPNGRLADDQTGFHCRTRDEYIAALERIAVIDGRECRREFETHFNAAAMAAAYERVCERTAEEAVSETLAFTQ